jgi:hypothetical protein
VNREERQAYLRKELLTALDQCGSYLLPEPAFCRQVMMSSAPPPTQAEFDEALRFLDANRLATAVSPALGGARKWKITDAGRAALQECG